MPTEAFEQFFEILTNARRQGTNCENNFEKAQSMSRELVRYMLDAPGINGLVGEVIEGEKADYVIFRDDENPSLFGLKSLGTNPQVIGYSSKVEDLPDCSYGTIYRFVKDAHLLVSRIAGSLSNCNDVFTNVGKQLPTIPQGDS